MKANNKHIEDAPQSALDRLERLERALYCLAACVTGEADPTAAVRIQGNVTSNASNYLAEALQDYRQAWLKEVKAGDQLESA
jgi:hypothetical protein